MPPIIKTNVWTFIKEYFLITIGILVYTTGWTVFLVPNNLVGGGVTGISSIIQYAVGIKIGYSYFVINLLLLVAAFITLGSSFSGKTIYAIILASLSLNLLQTWIPQSIITTLALQNGKLMSTIMGGIMAGLGIGISISQGGSTGGTDIIAIIVNKYRNISPGKMILSMDVVIILSSILFPSYTTGGALVPFADKITTVVYGLILVTVNSYVIDLYLSGSKQSVQLMILSKKYSEIADAITTDLHRGVTVLNGKGWYTKDDTEVLMVITRKTDLNLLLKYIKAVDPNAFLSVTSVTGVYGKGFDAIKGNSKAKLTP
jgi:uncharacterized membrane-anchored protein YitT (DUF2179 family)